MLLGLRTYFESHFWLSNDGNYRSLSVVVEAFLNTEAKVKVLVKKFHLSLMSRFVPGKRSLSGKFKVLFSKVMLIFGWTRTPLLP